MTWVAGAGGGGGGKGGGGGGGSEQRTPTEAPDSLSSISYANIIDLLGEGEIAGLKDGLKSVYLNGTPLQAADGTFNFQNATIITRNGTQAQSYIPGFSDIESEIGVGVQVLQATPIVRTITNASTNAVRVTVSVPALQSFSDNGDINGASVQLLIAVQYNGGGYTTVVNDTIAGKTSAQYQRSYRIRLSGAFPVSVRVTRVSADPSSTRVQNLLNWVSYTEITEAKVRYPNAALVAARIDAKQFSSIPTRSYRVRGLKIRIPSNATVDQTNGRLIYSGVWDGTFQGAQWCSDPAWCLWDLLTSTRYGLGDFISSAQLDKWAFYSASQYCSELVPDGFGGTEPRFSLNININTAQEVYNLINDLLSVFRGMGYWSAGALTIMQDRPQDPAFLFTAANVVNGTFTYTGSSLKQRPTVAVVEWLDLTTQDTAFEYVEDSAGIAKYGIVVQEVRGIGCTSRGQANRVGRWLLYTGANETEVVQFNVGIDGGVMVRPGMVVAVSDPTRAGARMGGRISSASTTAVTIDQDVTLGSSAKLSVILPDGTLQTRNVTGKNGRAIAVSPGFSQVPQPQSIWMLEWSGLQSQLFRVVSISEGQDATYQVSALTYNPSKFGAVEQGLTLQPRNVSLLTGVPNAPTGITVQESLYADRGNVKVLVAVSWVPVLGVDHYQVAYRVDSNNWVDVGDVQQAAFEVRDAKPGTWQVKVIAVSVLGKVSQPAILAQNVNGLLAPPAAVTGFSVVPTAGQLLLTWDQATDLDVLNGGSVWITYSPLTSGAVFENSITVVQPVPGSATQVLAPALDGTYFAKFKDSSGVASMTATSAVTSAPGLVGLNVVATVQEDPAFTGAKTNTIVDSVRGGLVLTGATNVDSYASVDGVFDWDFAYGVASSGSYLFPNTLDLGQIYTARAVAAIKVAGFQVNDYIDSVTSIDDYGMIDGTVPASGNAMLNFRTTTDDPGGSPTWTDWKPFFSADYTARAYQFRLDMMTSDPVNNLAVQQLRVSVDVPDRVESIRGLVSGAATYAVTYPNAFWATPTVAVTMQSAATGDYFVITGQTRTGFSITFYNAGGTVISRTFDVLAKGYGRAQ